MSAFGMHITGPVIQVRETSALPAQPPHSQIRGQGATAGFRFGRCLGPTSGGLFVPLPRGLPRLLCCLQPQGHSQVTLVLL